MKHILSYGGGVNSSALFFFLMRKDYPLDVVVFADTGEEMPETYEAVERMKFECQERGVQFVTVRSEYGRLVDYYTKKRAIPSLMRRDCTGKFKVEPIRKYLRVRFGKGERFGLYIGIAYDEAHRVRNSDVKYIENLYPFCDHKIDREGNMRILAEHRFPARKSGCQGCMYQNRAEWIRFIKEFPQEYARWEAMEKNCSRYPRMTLTTVQSLESMRRAVQEQKTLKEFKEIEAPCIVYGGCFL